MSAMLASDDSNPNFVGARNPDSALHVRFYSRPVQNNFLTVKEGTPIFEDVIYIEIHTPGSQLNIIDVPVREDHKARFPMQWAHFRNTHGDDNKVIGTPISQWPLLTAAQAETIKGLGFKTVQQVAFASDEQISKVGMYAGMAPMVFRDRAKRFLEAAQGEASLNKQADEMEALKKQIADLTAMLTNKSSDGPANDERAELASRYEAKFGKKPHHKLGVEKLKEAIA